MPYISRCVKLFPFRLPDPFFLAGLITRIQVTGRVGRVGRRRGIMLAVLVVTRFTVGAIAGIEILVEILGQILELPVLLHRQGLKWHTINALYKQTRSHE